MSEPLAYFLTWTTYGTWLPGDERGWIQQGHPGVQAPDPKRKEIAEKLLSEDPVILSRVQRDLVHAVIVEHCRIRGWQLHACNVRTNHVHVVVTAPVPPEKVRQQFKAWTSRRLSDDAGLTGNTKDGRKKWWTEGGSDRFINSDQQLEETNHYVLDGQ